MEWQELLSQPPPLPLSGVGGLVGESVVVVGAEVGGAVVVAAVVAAVVGGAVGVGTGVAVPSPSPSPPQLFAAQM